jgi:hypothetical protein
MRFRRHDICTKFHIDRFRHSDVNEGGDLIILFFKIKELG